MSEPNLAGPVALHAAACYGPSLLPARSSRARLGAGEVAWPEGAR